MSTRIHWLRPIDQRITACGRNAFHSDFFDGSAAEYLGVSNFCVKCELAAQKEHGSGKPKRIPAPQWHEQRPDLYCKRCARVAADMVPTDREEPGSVTFTAAEVEHLRGLVKYLARGWVGGNGAEGLRVLREKVGRD